MKSVCYIIWSRASIADQEPATPSTRGNGVRVLDLLVIKSEALYNVNDVHIYAVTPWAILMAGLAPIVVRLKVKLVMIRITYH